MSKAWQAKIFLTIQNKQAFNHKLFHLDVLRKTDQIYQFKKEYYSAVSFRGIGAFDLRNTTTAFMKLNEPMNLKRVNLL